MTTNETNNQGVDFTVEQVYNILYGMTEERQRIFKKYDLEDYANWGMAQKKEYFGGKIVIYTSTKAYVIQDIKVESGNDSAAGIWKAWKSMFILGASLAKVKQNIKELGGSMPSLMPVKGVVAMYNNEGINIFSSDLYGDCADNIRFAPKSKDIKEASKPKEIRDCGFRQAKAMFTLLGADKLIRQYRYEKEEPKAIIPALPEAILIEEAEAIILN